MKDEGTEQIGDAIIITNLKQEVRWYKIMVSRLEKEVKELEDKLIKKDSDIRILLRSKNK